MNYAECLIAALGGPAEAGRLTGIPVTTIRDWVARGTIPDRKKIILSQAAAAAGRLFPAADWLPNGVIVSGQTVTSEGEQNHD